MSAGRDMDKCPAIHAEIDAISKLRKFQNVEPKIKKTKNLIMVVTYNNFLRHDNVLC